MATLSAMPAACWRLRAERRVLRPGLPKGWALWEPHFESHAFYSRFLV